ncbi:hypothetical protein Psuf_041390 [Phytohabitans suffuscus]|uniref:Oxidoreductase n=1 Tax=Phytohabitans suffuscus TaxID=624315 RepID=A0A6F8YL86_9ACTN|nr:hypothetical protein Psuf_041390 [Phytohabitans suffuscus]
MRNGVRGVLAGVAAAAVALGLAEFVAVFTGSRSAPLVAVGGVVVDHVPEPLKQFAIDTFGTHDKTALLTGTVVLLAAFAALIGWLALRNIWYGVAGIALFGAVGVASALSRPDAGIEAAVPSLLGAAVAAAVLWRLLAAPAEIGDSGDRRRFLTGVAVVAGAAALSGLGGRWLSTRRTVSEARRAVRLPVPASPAPPVPAGPSWTSPSSRRTSPRTAPSTASTPRSWCRRWTRRRGRCGSTGGYATRSRSPSTSCWPGRWSSGTSRSPASPTRWAAT